MLCFLKPEDIARVLNDQVLEPAAGAETRNAILAGVADRPQSLAHVLIGAPRSYPNARKTLEQIVVYFLC